MPCVLVVEDEPKLRELLRGYLERDGHTVAHISKRWFRVRDTYGVEIRPGEDEGLLLAVVVALESLTD